ncbi:MAG: hypothetical protein C0402_07915 [Thermodesulfovibrio sp.]|nr:hypothetical protein [Thermodesulfovibrio sp.]
MECGENKCWDILATADPAAICRSAAVDFDASSGCYILKSFGAEILISPADKTISGSGKTGELLLTRLGYFSRLSILWYLVSAKDIALSGKLINPLNLRGGHLFFRGTHILPLDKLAEKFNDDTEGFLNKGISLGGEKVLHGDAAVRFFPLPRIPVTLILWRGNDEFPPGADLLFDSTAEVHLAIDVLWSIAMMNILIMM